MREQVTLCGESAEQFSELRDDLEEQLGREPSNAEMVRLMMSYFDADDIL